MDELKKLVGELEECKDTGRQIALLQAIGDKLLASYVIKVGEVTIEPLWVEAYYYNEDNGFIDESVHRTDDQINNFGHLYFHNSTGNGRSGVDICLSKGNYYLSYLLKYTLADGVFTTQAQLHNIISDQYDDNAQILIPKENPCKLICHAKRINDADSAGTYKDEELASVRDVNKTFKDGEGKTTSLPDKTKILKKYIAETYKPEERRTEADKERISKELVGEYWKNLFD